MSSQPQAFTLAVSPQLSLVSLLLAPKSATPAKAAPVATNHIIVIDCSGSMYSELPKIRQQLKNKLPTLVREGDAVSLVWFSGRGQYGTIVEGLEIKSAEGLQRLQAAVDRYLQPKGLTGFKEPLESISGIVRNVTAVSGIRTHSLLFLTDGYDNEWSTSQVINAVKPLGLSLASAVFVEYGYYANRTLLTKMAEEIGGRNIFSQDFPDFEPQLEAFVTAKASAGVKQVVNLPTAAKYELAYSVDAEGITVYGVEDQQIAVGPDVDRVFYHSLKPVGKELTLNESSGLAVYASLALLSQRMKSQDVWDLLAYLGDVEFIDANANAFGKQKLYAFQNMCLEVVLGQRKPYALGQSSTHAPDVNAYCLLDLLQDLGEEDENRFLSENPAFVYQRIGAKKVAAVSKEETLSQQALADVAGDYLAALALEKTPESRQLVLEAARKVAEASALVQASVTQEVRFRAIPNDQGTPITDLVWNESRPNLSVRVMQRGTVQVPANDYGLSQVESHRHRTYTLVKDGIVNVEQLPVRLGKATFEKIMARIPHLVQQQVREEAVSYVDNFDGSTVFPEVLLRYVPATTYESETVYVLNLKGLPIINRQMVQEVSAKELFQLQYALLMAQGAQSVFNHFQKLHFPKESRGYTELYGAEASEWLKNLGLTDYNGFAPRVTDEKSGDSYPATELNVTLEGFKSKPTVKAVWDKLKAGKGLTEREKIFEASLLMYCEFTESSFYLDADAATQQLLLKTWLLNKQKAVVTQVRGYLSVMARIKFGVILGQTWFKEFTDLEDNTLTMTFDGKPVVCQAKLEDTIIAV